MGIRLGRGARKPAGAPAGFSTEAQNYFTRLDSAGDTTYTAYKQPIANYIDGLVSNNLWDGLESSALFVGVGFEGITVPLRGDMPTLTNNNFVSGDQSVTDGLAGDGLTKEIATGTFNDDTAQDDQSMSAYVTVGDTVNGYYISGGRSVGGVTNIGRGACRMRSTTSDAFIGGLGLMGVSRANSAEFTRMDNNGVATVTRASQTPSTDEVRVFNRPSGKASDARLATYHVGSSLNLATLETLQDQLIADIAAVSYLLDIYTGAAAAYSLRELSPSFVGSDLILARRSSDNAELGFTATEITDGTLETWAGVGDAFIKTWYDQSGNARNATQATAGSQPSIVSGGVLNPTGVLYDGTADVLPFSSIATGSTLSFFAVHTLDSSKTSQRLTKIGLITVKFDFNLLVWAGTGGQLYVNGAAASSGSRDAAFNSTVTDTQILAMYNVSSTLNTVDSIGFSAPNQLKGGIQEIVFYDSDQVSNRVGIETEINSHYSIY